MMGIRSEPSLDASSFLPLGRYLSIVVPTRSETLFERSSLQLVPADSGLLPYYPTVQ